MVQITSALLLLSAASSAFATQCFYPAGNPAPGNVPCDENAEVSPCCASKDRCLSNGLCRVNDDPSTTEYARGACTDEEWGPGCFPQCLISHPGSPVTNGAAVFMCNSTGWTDPKGASYCCEKSIDQKTGCCSGNDLFWLPPGGVALPVSSAPAPAPVPSSTSTSTVSSETPSVTTVDSFTTTTVPCTTSTSSAVSSVSAPAQQNTSSTDVVVVSSTTSTPVTTDVVSTGTVVAPTNGSLTLVSPSQPVSTGAASKFQVAGVAGLVGAFAYALL